MQQSKIKKNKNNAYKEMHDAQIYEDKTSNAWRIQQRSKELDQGPKELDQGPKEYKLNHKNPASPKQNKSLQQVSHKKWDSD